MNINWVKQTKNTCGQTCVAMIAGISLDESLSYFNKKRSTRTIDVHNALSKLGFNTPKKRIRLRGKGYEYLPELCIVNIRWYDKNGNIESMGHWSVYYNGTFYDPETGEFTPDDYKKMLDLWNGKITSYLPVERSYE